SGRKVDDFVAFADIEGSTGDFLNEISRRHLEAAPNVEVFRLRCEARAFLVQEGEMDLHEAVDGLQASAAHLGLIEQIGQDTVQAIMAETFAGVSAILPEIDT